MSENMQTTSALEPAAGWTRHPQATRARHRRVMCRSMTAMTSSNKRSPPSSGWNARCAESAERHFGNLYAIT